ncbi:MAG: thioredoxin domain-containing protein, partial [Acidimicrobiia bacterium]|nr:thioredoxin domain-containing protein [Acidimicrobiia bacterium]
MTGRNRLGEETSPYLRQHRDNPVHWSAWGPDAFAEAARRDVPVLLSIGYSACHWCHVMAHESFEDDDVATAMNQWFVNVKVDREERPDVDAVYMDAVQAMTGHGGWPLTAFLSPSGEPFYGGTYFPKPNFLALLAAVDDAWRNRRADLDRNTMALRQAISRTARIEPAVSRPGLDAIDAAVAAMSEQFDAEWGGFGSAPKFPSTMALDLVLASFLRTGDDRAREIVTTSLDAMASGGMYDHIGGGFARYSVDRQWLVPHFEKMLYDQALLIRVYAHAAVALGNPAEPVVERWRQVVDETVAYVLRDLRRPHGGVASAEDADSPGPDGHGHEGLFHTWTPTEVREAFAGDAADEDVGAVLAFYGITADGNFEGRSIPNRLHARA